MLQGPYLAPGLRLILERLAQIKTYRVILRTNLLVVPPVGLRPRVAPETRRLALGFSPTGCTTRGLLQPEERTLLKSLRKV